MEVVGHRAVCDEEVEDVAWVVDWRWRRRWGGKRGEKWIGHVVAGTKDYAVNSV